MDKSSVFDFLLSFFSVSQPNTITAEAITMIQMQYKSLGTALTTYHERTRTILQRFSNTQMLILSAYAILLAQQN